MTTMADRRGGKDRDRDRERDVDEDYSGSDVDDEPMDAGDVAAVEEACRRAQMRPGAVRCERRRSRRRGAAQAPVSLSLPAGSDYNEEKFRRQGEVRCAGRARP